ncbi:C2HC-type zinc finger protein, partial [Acidithiobacillus sp.]|uniref:C2HC-type zinc finger protein n=1 Tax=Acidithiobacillus sp. TaxID=1872118 RepID=UPI003D01239B
MQSRVEEHPEFDTTIKNNLIKLLEVIKVLMHEPVCAQYPMISMTDALTRLINAKQAENEPLLDYIKRFKQLRDVAVSHMGSEMLHKFCEFQVEFKDLKTDLDKKNYKDEAFEAWMAYLLIRGSDQNKYGSLTKNFISQYSLGNDQYPRTITMATDVLSNHRLDPKFFENQKRHREQQQQHQYRSDGEITGVASFAQKDKDVTCFICGKAGHRSPQCPDKDNIPRAKWAINRAMAGLQSGGNDSDAADDMSEMSAEESVKTTTSSRSARSK